jgi:hypothetical protein
MKLALGEHKDPTQFIAITPSVYVHVVHVPCSPMSPVIVALNALPPTQIVRFRSVEGDGDPTNDLMYLCDRVSVVLLIHTEITNMS